MSQGEISEVSRFSMIPECMTVSVPHSRNISEYKMTVVFCYPRMHEWRVAGSSSLVRSCKYKKSEMFCFVTSNIFSRQDRLSVVLRNNFKMQDDCSVCSGGLADARLPECHILHAR